MSVGWLLRWAIFIYWSLNFSFVLSYTPHYRLVDLASPPKTVCMHKILTLFPCEVPFLFFFLLFFTLSSFSSGRDWASHKRTSRSVETKPYFQKATEKGCWSRNGGSKSEARRIPSEQDIRRARRSLRIQEVEGNGKLNELYPLKIRLCWRDTQIPKCNFLRGKGGVEWKRVENWQNRSVERKNRKSRYFLIIPPFFFGYSPSRSLVYIFSLNYGSCFLRKWIKLKLLSLFSTSLRYTRLEGKLYDCHF